TPWRATLVAWSTDPLLGIGPGYMPYARQAAAPDFTFPVRQPHSHNLPLGVLGDAGLLGLAAAVVLLLALASYAAPWRGRGGGGGGGGGGGAGGGFVFFGGGGGGGGAFWGALTFVPAFNLLAI